MAFRFRTRSILYYFFWEHEIFGNATFYTLLSSALLLFCRYVAYNYVKNLYDYHLCSDILSITGFKCVLLYKTMYAMSQIFQNDIFALVSLILGTNLGTMYVMKQFRGEERKHWYFVYSMIGTEDENILRSRPLAKARSRVLPEGNKEISKGYKTFLEASDAYREFRGQEQVFDEGQALTDD